NRQQDEQEGQCEVETCDGVFLRSAPPAVRPGTSTPVYPWPPRSTRSPLCHPNAPGGTGGTHWHEVSRRNFRRFGEPKRRGVAWRLGGNPTRPAGPGGPRRGPVVPSLEPPRQALSPASALRRVHPAVRPAPLPPLPGLAEGPGAALRGSRLRGLP